MKTVKLHHLVCTITTLLLMSCIILPAQAASLPINKADGKITQWLILGPFTVNQDTGGDTSKLLKLNLDCDFLDSIGGESKAQLIDGQIVVADKIVGKVKSAKAKPIIANLGGNQIPDINLSNVLGPKNDDGTEDYFTAYAFTYIDSDRDTKAYFGFGADDYARVWINGKQVVYKTTETGTIPHEQFITANLHKGLNTVMVKVVNGALSWGYSFDSMTKNQRREEQAKHAEEQALSKARDNISAFLDAQIVPNRPWAGYVFTSDEVPGYCWDRPNNVNRVIGELPLKLRWFDSELNEVKAPKKAGKYSVIIEGNAKNGTHVCRALTVYCRPSEWRYWEHEPKAYLDPLPGFPVSSSVWTEYREEIAKAVGNNIYSNLDNTPSGAVLVAYLSELESGKAKASTSNPSSASDDFQLAVKLKLIGAEGKYKPLQMPHKKAGNPATALHPGTLEEAGIKPDMPENVRKVCREWAETTKIPFAICIVRHGVVAMHESFGVDENGKQIPVDKPMEMASITKAMSGMLFAQFMDQGLINLDDPVGKYLPDFPTTGNKAITLRHCFTHTSGLWGHYNWGGMHNPWLDNVIADALPVLQPGKRHEYNGMGYDLAGKVMEVVAGKGIFQLFKENFFTPLGATHTTNDDLACATQSTAEDVAKMGQLLLNHGSYGDTEFFSPNTFEQIMPKNLDKYYPEVKNVEWGVGLVYYKYAEDPNPINVDLSSNTIGHGAASGAILRVDLDNDLVITLNRNTPGDNYSYYERHFLQAIGNGLVK
ncbi:MAG: serine hydrolase [Armatimonadota bacterium]|nr:serine hydrolase [bacterium]